MELAELIESRVVSLHHDALRVINCCLAGTATHKLFDLLESVFGPDLHLGPSFTGTAVSEEEDDLADEGDEDLPTEGTTEPSQFPEAESREYQELQKAIKQSTETAAEAGEDISSAPVSETVPPLGQSSQAPPPTEMQSSCY